MAEFYAGCATAEEMLLAREFSESSFTWTARAARGICRREGVGSQIVRCSEAMSQNSFMQCVQTRSRVGAGRRIADRHGISGYACTSSKIFVVPRV